jgi:hypothetical protein
MDITIPEEYIIYDTRLSNDFKGITISGYKRTDVIKAYQNAMINNKLEEAIRWCVELNSTGLNKQIWSSLKTIYMKYIHVNNPKYFFYLNKREKEYFSIIDTYSKKYEIFTRNNQEIRNLLSELTAISSLTKKNNLFLPKSLPSINQSSFLQENIKMRMISKNTDYVEEYIFNNTTPEMKIALNEILNNLLFKYGTFENCIYWYQWMEKVESIQKNKMKPQSDLTSGSVIFSSNNSNLNNKFFDSWLFILWKIVLNFENKLEKNDFKFIKKLEKMYKKDFKLTHASTKKFYIFISFYIIKKNINWNIYIFQQEHLILQSVANINKMYENIIIGITNNLTKEQKDILITNYNTIYSTIQPEIGEKNKMIKKVKNTSLDNVLLEDINKVSFTKYNDYIDISTYPNNNVSNTEEPHINKNKLISKNKSLQDIIDEKELKKQKKLQAFTGFISYKKKKDDLNDNKPKNVIEYYNSENSPEEDDENNIKSIEFNIKLSKSKDLKKLYDD